MRKIIEQVKAELSEFLIVAVLNPLSETSWVVLGVLALMLGRQL